MGTSVLQEATVAEGVVDVLAPFGAVGVESLDLKVLEFADLPGDVQVVAPEEIVHVQTAVSQCPTSSLFIIINNNINYSH
jgi:hypothetical protein